MRDCDFKYAPGTGTAIANFTLAVDKVKKEGQKSANFINCVAFGKRAETISQYVFKGHLISVSGSLENNNYEKDGKTVYRDNVLVDEFQFLEKKQGDNNQNTNRSTSDQMDDAFPPGGYSDSDIDF